MDDRTPTGRLPAGRTLTDRTLTQRTFSDPVLRDPGRGRDARTFTGRTATGGPGWAAGPGAGGPGRSQTAIHLEVHGGHRTDRRRCSRYDATLKVRRVTRERETLCFTSLVAKNGMFIHTERPARANQLLCMRVTIPEHDDELRILGLVRWRRTPVEARSTGLPAGMGVAFYQISDTDKAPWAEMIRTFGDRLHFAPEDAPGVRTETGPIRAAAQRRRQSRLRRALTVSWTVAGRIYQNVTDDLSDGGFFIPQVQSIPPGTRVEFTLFSTANLDAFRVYGEILRIERGQAGRHGCAVRILQLMDGDALAFERFIPPDDPGLTTDEEVVLDEPPSRRVGTFPGGRGPAGAAPGPAATAATPPAPRCAPPAPPRGRAGP